MRRSVEANIPQSFLIPGDTNIQFIEIEFNKTHQHNESCFVVSWVTLVFTRKIFLIKSSWEEWFLCLKAK